MLVRSRSRRWMPVVVALCLALPVRVLLAQNGVVSGKVSDKASGAPINEVRIVIPGTTLETQTNSAGEYRITNVRPGRITVGVFKLGYRAASDTVRLTAGGSVTADFQLTASLVTLSQVVVTGTAGNQERRAQSAQVASVDASSITKSAPIASVGELLQSRLPGVSVNSSSGTAGTSKEIRIRGASSINLSNEPLIFVDGVQINTGRTNAGFFGQQYDRLNDLDPDEIQSIEVVKGPAAATLYGADASAGVIQIITKKGNPGANRFAQTLRVEGGSSDVNWTPPSNYGLCTAALVASTSANPLCRGQAVGTMVHDNPLLRVGAFRTGTDRQIGWNGRGGGQNYGYNLSFGTQNTLGTLPNNTFQRYNIRTNFNYVPDSRLTIEAGLGLAQSLAVLPNNDNDIYGWLGGALLGSPLTRVDNGLPSQDGWYGFNRHYNAIKSIEHSQLTHRVTTNLTATYLPWSWFSNRFTAGMDYASDELINYFPVNDSTWYGGANNTGSKSQTARGDERYTIDYLGNVRRDLGAESQWEANLSFGLQVISTREQVLNATGLGFVTNANNVIGAAATTTGGGSFFEQKSYGYLSQLQVGYRNRAFVQFAVRVDKNSSFGSAAPSFVLPKVGATWTMSDEKFFEPFKKYVNSLRVRASWGTTGRSPAAGAALTTLSAAPYNIVGTTNAGAVPGNPGNPNLKPERGNEFESGIDASFWHDRVTTELTYFHKTTNDLIIAKPIPPSLGFSSNPLANLGSVLNSGFELSVNATAVETKNFSWDIQAGANTLHNELTSLGGVAPFALGPAGRTLVGQQVGVFVSKKIESIDVANKKVVVSDTLAPVGNLFPTLEWNLTNTFTFMKNFRVSALLDAKRDFLVQNFTAFFRETQLVRSNLRIDTLALSPYERLRRFGDLTPGHTPFTTDKGNPATVSDVVDAYLEPGDFVRLREVSATYTLPAGLLDFAGNRLRSASITLAFQNVKLWTKYSGADPEVVSNPSTTNGPGGQFSRQDFLTMPNAKQTVLRLNITF